MNDSLYYQLQLNSFACLQSGYQILSRSAIVGLLSLSSWVFVSTGAQAQFSSNQKVVNFVQSILEMELARETTLQNTQGANPTAAVPVFDCNLEVGSVINANGLSNNVMNHLQNFCGQSQTILQQHNLSPEEFYQMRKVYGQNPRQYPQITQTFQRLCQNNRYSQLQICR